METWRDKITPTLRLQLEKVIRNSADHKESITKAKDKKTAQLWVALALLSKDLQESKIRTKYLETIVVELLEEKKKSLRSKKKKAEVEKLIKTLKKF